MERKGRGRERKEAGGKAVRAGRGGGTPSTGPQWSKRGAAAPLRPDKGAGGVQAGRDCKGAGGVQPGRDRKGAGGKAARGPVAMIRIEREGAQPGRDLP
jgi:hypothetical protein